MTLNELSLHPRQYFTLNEPLIIFVKKSKYKEITSSEFEIICETLSKRRIPLVISGKEEQGKNGKYWKYYLQMPNYSLHIMEADNGKINLVTDRYISDGGDNRSYHNRNLQMFFLEAAKGIYLIYQLQAYYVSTDGTWRCCSKDENVDWNMSPDGYDEMMERMRNYFEDKEKYSRSQKVSESMRKNVLDPFVQYTQKEHEFETRKVDFTRGVLYTGKVVAGISRGKRSSYELISNDPSADPENCTLAVGQRVAVYREDESFTNLVGLLVEIDSAADDGVRFVLEFYQQFDRTQLPDRGYLFVHQNDTQLKIRRNVKKCIEEGDTKATYIYKTFHDFSVVGYEDLQRHPTLVDFLYQRMGQKFPPNQMQLEAIVKGILTEDLLLVLGPPGTGKTTVILYWVEYYLSQGKRILISSQNNSAVDNVLNRLGEEKNREIVRLGREEKIQENCKQFIPYYRIGTMRSSCEKNSARLETQLSGELNQIDVYIDALRQLRRLLADAENMRMWLDARVKEMDATCTAIRECYRELLSAEAALQENTAAVDRYNSYLEESEKKGLLTKLVRFGSRLHAKHKREELLGSAPHLEAYLRSICQQYITHCKDLEVQTQQLRDANAIGCYKEFHNGIRSQQAQILGKGEHSSGLVPIFESELKYAEALNGFVQPSEEDLNKAAFLDAQISIMEQVRISAEKIRGASRHWVNAALKGDRNEVFEEILLEACQVVGATCIGINSNKLFREVEFDVTIIDESGQIQLQNALVPITRSPKTLMLGDYKQIPPIVNDDIVKSCINDDIPISLYKQSFFEFLFEEMRSREIRYLTGRYQREQNEGKLSGDAPETADPRERAKKEILLPCAENYVGKPIKEISIREDGKEEVHYKSRYSCEEVEKLINQITQDRKKIVNLNSQFRMAGNISDVISEWFYENNYHSSYDMSQFKPVVPGTDLPLVIIDTSRMRDRFEIQPDNNMGYQNLAEAELVADALEAVLKELDEKARRKYLQSLDEHLGIISAYGAQVRHIRQVLVHRLGLSKKEAATAVASLDSFQGQERDLIIYSVTRSSRKHRELDRVGFLKELRRLNVAFTRCKKQLVIIGDMNFLLNCMYVNESEDRDFLPCVGTTDDWIDKKHIDQCAECTASCERRVARFFRLLMQHAKADPPAGNLIPAAQFKESLKGGANHA